jgi:hypothetical protein
MDELVGRLAAKAGIDSAVAETVSMDSGLMALGTRLIGLGLGIGEIQSVARELFRFGRDKIGADQIGEIVKGTPGLSQFA